MSRCRVLLLVVVSILIFGCKKDDAEIYVGLRDKVDHTLFVYLGNLPDEIMESNIADMLTGLNRFKPNGNIVIFYDRNDSITELIELKEVRDGVYRRSVLKSYGENLNSSSLDVFKLALKDLKKFTSSGGYSMILSSHGSGWIDDDMIRNFRPRSAGSELLYTPNPLTRAIVDSGRFGDGMDLYDVADAMPEGMFDFILFDACNMGSIEVVYALKDRVDFIIASPSEVLIDGFPYSTIIGNIFDKRSVEGSLTEICVKFFDLYKNHEAGCNIALYDCSKVDDVATAFSSVVDAAFERNITPSPSGLQWYDGPIFPHIMYDMQEFADVWIGKDSELTELLATSLDRMIVYANTTTTSHILYNLFKSPVSAYCGVSVYVPQKLEYTNRCYMATDWYRRVYGSNDITTLFN